MNSINVLAPVNQLGYGVVGLNVLLALERGGYQPALWPIGNIDAPAEHHEALCRMSGRTMLYDPAAPSLRLWHQFDLAKHVGKGLHCGMPIFELTRFRPNELHHLRCQDIVFANSNWAVEVLVNNGVNAERIASAPLGVDTTLFQPQRNAPAPALPTIFLNVGKWEIRKGHDVLVRAFNAAFSKNDNVRLVMACHNPCFSNHEQEKRYNHQWRDLYKQSRLGEKIEVLAERLASQQQVAALMRWADCGVFPSRAEGWNLELLEMLACGKTVIATNYSAHTQYLTSENALLIETDSLEDAFDGCWFTGQGQWATLGKNQLDQLVEHLRKVHKARQEGSLTENEAGRKTASLFTWEKTAQAIAGRLSC